MIASTISGLKFGLCMLILGFIFGVTLGIKMESGIKTVHTISKTKRDKLRKSQPPPTPQPSTHSRMKKEQYKEKEK